MDSKLNNLSIDQLNEILEKVIHYSPKGLINFVPPKDLEVKLEEMLTPNQNSLMETVDFVLKHCVNTSNRHFVNQLYGAVNPVGLAGAFLVEKMNTNQHTYEVAPVFVLTERIILRLMRKIFFGSETGDGIFCPGGSIANMYGLLIARHKKFPDIKKTGLFGLRALVVYVSEDAHYSIAKMANVMGLGQDNVVKIKTCKNGAMVISELETSIEQSKSERKMPLAVVATSGTTVLGGFDNLEEIAKICKRENIWLHCDAAWGGSFIFSPQLRSKWLNGIEKCDSILWNAHKMLGAPLQCSIFITKEQSILGQCNSVSAPYLFQSNKHYAEEYDNIGDKSIQCGRKSDAFKLFLMISHLGLDHFQFIIERTEDCARYFTEKIRNRKGFLLYLNEHQCTNVFFWYIPTRFQNQEKSESWWSEIGKITVQIRTELLLNNQVMIGYSPLPKKNIPNTLRLVLTAHPLKNYDDMDYIIENIEKVGTGL